MLATMCYAYTLINSLAFSFTSISVTHTRTVLVCFAMHDCNILLINDSTSYQRGAPQLLSFTHHNYPFLTLISLSVE